MTITFVIPPPSDGKVRLVSTAMPGDFYFHGSDGALAYSSSSLDTRVWSFSFRFLVTCSPDALEAGTETPS